MSISNMLFAQRGTTYTISGIVKDDSTGNSLTGARVYLKENPMGATITNQEGYFTITSLVGNYSLIVSFIGYSQDTLKINVNANLTLGISLKPSSEMLNKVVVKGIRENKNVESSEVGRFTIPIKQLKELPSLFGEVDVMKIIQLTPGVQATGEGNTGFYVRGGGPDENLILLDNAVVYNPSHLLGFFSIFNSDALENFELIKAGMPANYGGRLASVLDITTRDGDLNNYHVTGGIGLISSHITAEGPIKKNKSSFIISARRTYILQLVQPFLGSQSPIKGVNYYFYDMNARLNYILSTKDRLAFSGYIGNDVFTMKQNGQSFTNDIRWGNVITSLKWTHIYSNKLFSDLSAFYTNYKFQFSATQDSTNVKIFSGIKDWSAKLSYSYIPSEKQDIKFGADYTFHTFTPNNTNAQAGNVQLNTGTSMDMYANDVAAYLSDDVNLNERIKLNGGLRFTFFEQTGPFNRYVTSSDNVIIDTIHYASGAKVKSYSHIEPRLSFRYSLNPSSSIKASFTQNYQYINLASISDVTLPMDLWIPSTSLVKPQFGSQYSLGFYKNFRKNMFESSVEVYYKEMHNMIEFKEGYVPLDNTGNNIDNSLTFGTGRSYGSEFFLKKRTGKLTGWVGYTLSFTTRTFSEINQGQTFWAKYDHRHDVDIALTYDISKKLTASVVWVYTSGNALTPPIGRYFFDNQIIIQWGAMDSYRMAPYHRMDVSLTYTPQKKKRFEQSWNFSVYNLYDRHNPYYIAFVTTGNLNDYNVTTSAKQISLFPLLPSVSWSFKF